MAYFSLRPSLISCLVLTFLLFAASSSALKVVEVNDICNQTENPSFCTRILNSKPGGAKGANLVSLAQYTIDVVRGNITNTINLIQSLIAHSGSDRNAEDYYEECLLHFDYKEGALGDIKKTQVLLKSGDYFGVRSTASAVIGDIEDCTSGVSPSHPPYLDTSKLPQYGDVIEQIVEIIIVISKYLTQK